jgi:hypothetical protein
MEISPRERKGADDMREGPTLKGSYTSMNQPQVVTGIKMSVEEAGGGVGPSI